MNCGCIYIIILEIGIFGLLFYLMYNVWKNI